MQLIFDNIVAVLVSTTLLVILLLVSQRGQENAVDETNFASLRAQQLAWVQTLQRDMAGLYRVETVTESADSTFAFWTRLADSSDTIRVAYRRYKVGQRDGADLFQVRRYESQSEVSIVPPKMSGGSMPTITSWEIVGLNRAGNQPEAPPDVRQIRVRFEAMMPFSSGNDLVRRPWEGTFFPVLLDTHRL